MEGSGDIILYETVRLRVVDKNAWLSQRKMAELFNVSLHLKNIYRGGELREEATVEESSLVQIEGTRKVRRPLKPPEEKLKNRPGS